MTGRVHETWAAGDPAPRRRSTEQAEFHDPRVRLAAEAVAGMTRPPADRFTMPTTAAELGAMSYDHRARVFAEDRELYDRLTGHAQPVAHAGGE
ncbi:hypothetical protein [Streptomyces sp. HC307]|uniref:hypothetical protein n=1 Tax=Streptomyces flavusporus TaxID=3385496 RepID=UPI003917245B